MLTRTDGRGRPLTELVTVPVTDCARDGGAASQSSALRTARLAGGMRRGHTCCGYSTALGETFTIGGSWTAPETRPRILFVYQTKSRQPNGDDGLKRAHRSSAVFASRAPNLALRATWLQIAWSAGSSCPLHALRAVQSAGGADQNSSVGGNPNGSSAAEQR